MSTFTTLVKPVDAALISLHYAFPATVFGYFAITSAVALCTLSDRKEHPRRRPLLALMLFTVLSYLAQIAAIIIPSIIAKEWLGQQDVMIGLLSCILVFGLQFAMLLDETEVAWYPFIGSYILSLGLEPALMAVALAARTTGPLSGLEVTQVSIVASRYLAIGLVVATYFTWRKADEVETKDATDAEQQPLIPKNPDGTPVQSSEEGEASQSSTAYGSTSTTATNSSANSTTGNPDGDNSTDGNKDDDKDKDGKTKKSDDENTNELPWERRERKRREEMEKRLKENGNWFDYAKRFMVSP